MTEATAVSGASLLSESKLVQLIATVYGPYAFGVASLLLIWYTIVSPQLERQAIDFARSEKVVEAQREILQSMATMTRSLEQASMSNEKAAMANEKVAITLQSTALTLERAK
jgi:hypothetical protein